MNAKLQNQTKQLQGMVHKKHTSCDNLSRRNLFHGSIMHISGVCLSVRQPLIPLILIATLLRIGTFSCLETRLVAIKTWLVAWWNPCASLPYAALRSSNRKSLAVHLLRLACLGFLLRWPVLLSRWTVLRPCCNRGLLLRCTCLIHPLAAL
jgi:hypothetical protein